MLVDGRRDDCNSHDDIAICDDLSDLLVLESDHVLSVDFHQLVVDEQPVSGSRGVLHQPRDLSVLEVEANVTHRVLVEGQCALKWPGKNMESEKKKKTIYNLIYDTLLCPIIKDLINELNL